MARPQASHSVLHEVFATGLYKRNQGRIVRQLTAIALGVTVFLGCYVLAQGPLSNYDDPVRYGVPFALLLLGCWASYRAVNYPKFADFLIAVEAEMAKVSWPTFAEVVRASLVVIVIMFLLAATLFLYDVIWQWFFELIGVLRLESAVE